jgi:diguanylate cyclase (GGDEF)-like protein/PAS domain S-box-containing protein
MRDGARSTARRPEYSGSADLIEASARRIAARYPDAVFAAIDVMVTPPFVPAPDSLDLPRDRFVEDPAAVEVLRPDDRATVAQLWGQARSQGLASAAVRLGGTPSVEGQLYLFDVRERHGVVLAVFVPGGPDPELGPISAAAPTRPRFATATKDAGALYRSVDEALTEMLGWKPDELIGRRALEFVHPDDHDAGIANWLEMLATPGRSKPNRLRHRHRSGSWVWLEITNHNRLAEPEGDVLAHVIDISEEMAAQEALRAREQLLAQLTDTVPVGLFHVDVQGNVLFANRPLAEITGTSAPRTIDELFVSVVPEQRSSLQGAMKEAGLGISSDIEITIRHEAGPSRHYLMSARPLRDTDSKVAGITGSLKDVTEMVDSRRLLEWRASSDVLTGCLNRDATIAAIQSLLDRPASAGGKTGKGTAVIFLDLDGFKQINDEHGHAAGDDFLITVASQLRTTIRAEDLLGRFGGDEFVVCGLMPSPTEALQAARSLGRRAFEGLDPVRASMGVAWTDELGASATGLVEAADRAMYESKRAGRGEPTLARRQPVWSAAQM